jgi:glycosyltransferase involved in cell wall biosynthesis
MKNLAQDNLKGSNEPLAGTRKILIIIPAFNEGRNIKATIDEISAQRLAVTVAVINDGSKDDTSLQARNSGVHVIDLPFNLGIGGAVQTGFKFALEHDFDVAVQVDGDTQHDVSYLPAILEPVIRGEADMTIGSRFLPPYLGYRSSLVRRVGIHFFAGLISAITARKVTDPTSGFRAFNKRMIRLFAGYYPHDFPEPEAIAVAARHMARVIEIPVKMRKRSAGNSSIRYLRTLYYMIKVTFAILLDKIKTKRGGPL